MSGIVINPFQFTAGGGETTETGITSLGTQGSDFNNPDQNGWEFTADVALTVTKLRLWAGHSSGNETLRLWRVSDETMLASVEVAASEETWVEGELSSSVSLSASANYIVTTRMTDGSSRDKARAQKGLTDFNENITRVQDRWATDSDAFPSGASDGGSLLQGIPDIVFTVD